MKDASVVSKIIKTLVFIFAIIFSGTAGYVFIEGYSISDAVYMTVITLTTTGFREVVPLTAYGRYFTIFLLLTGMGVVTYCITSLASYIASIDFSKRRRERMESKIGLLKKHTIVCGFGRMGEIICKKLNSEGVKFVVIEKNPELIKSLKDLGYFYIDGDAAHDDNLLKAGIESAKDLVSVIDSDADGLYIALAAKSFNPDMNIIVRANELSAQKRMIRAGATKVVLPFVMSGLKVAESVINPAAEDFFNIPDPNGESNEYIQVGDLFVNERSTIIGKTLSEIGHKLEGLIIVGVRKPDHSFIFKPRGSYTFEKSDCLITMGEASSHKMTLEEFQLDSHPPTDLKAAA